MIRAVGFDWDGTLVDSILVKSECFARSIVQLCPELEGEEEELKRIYLGSTGIPRPDQLEIVKKKYGVIPEDFDAWSKSFTDMYLESKLPLFKDTIPVLSELRKRGYKLFLGSSVPHDYLLLTLKDYPQVKEFFEVVLGSRGDFRKGEPHFTHVSKETGVAVKDIAFVGDSPVDVEVSKKAGVFSVGKTDSNVPGSKEAIEKAQPDVIVTSLKKLLDVFD